MACAAHKALTYDCTQTITYAYEMKFLTLDHVACVSLIYFQATAFKMNPMSCMQSTGPKVRP